MYVVWMDHVLSLLLSLIISFTKMNMLDYFHSTATHTAHVAVRCNWSTYCIM